MKIKLFVLILTGFIATGISVLKAETPVASSIGDDSTNNTYYPTLEAPFIVQPQLHVPVNESEIRAGLLYDAVNEKNYLAEKYVYCLSDSFIDKDDGRFSGGRGCSGW